MKSLAALCLTLASAGCGLHCSKADREGTYLMTAETMSGACGAVAPALVTIHAGEEDVPQGCALDYERWSADACELERSITCERAADGYRLTGAGVTSQMDASGATLSGTIEWTFYDLTTGAVVCIGTYNLTLKRQ